MQEAIKNQTVMFWVEEAEKNNDPNLNQLLKLEEYTLRESVKAEIRYMDPDTRSST